MPMVHQTWQGRYIQRGVYFPDIKTKEPLITGSCKVTVQIKYVISPLSQWLCLLNLPWLLHTTKKFFPQCQKIS